MNSKGYNTKPRAIILDILQSNKLKHLTADEILDILKDNQTPVGRATLYRYLDHLVQTGEVKKYYIGDGMSACYQYGDEKTMNHYHLKCNICGKLFHVELYQMDRLISSIKKQNGFLVDGARTIIYGVCDECNKNEFK